MPFSRRTFLQQASGAALAGMITRIPARQLWSMRAADVLPEPDEPYLRELAVKAMDAARAAGATFADIRLNAARYMYIAAGAGRRPNNPPEMVPPLVGCPIRYGIRTIVDGAWGFAAETDVSPDMIVATARKAVAVARANRTRHRTQLELAPVPVATGTWETPMERDPLSVPMHEIGALAVAAAVEAYKPEEIYSVYINLHWRRPTVVFASTDGSLVVQRFCYAGPSGLMYATTPKGGGSGVVRGFLAGPHGYEACTPDRIVAEAGEAARRAVAEARDPDAVPSVEPGRYDIVLSAGAAAGLVAGTLSAALTADYALGYMANGGGISFAAPPRDMLGTLQIASQLITVQADRTRPGGAATVGWDEEGVKPDNYTLIDRGIVTDYHTNRETAPELGAWYRSRGESVRSHGCMRRPGADVPATLTPNLTVLPGPGSTRMEDLVSDVKKGFYITDLRGTPDHQVLSAQYYSESARAITNGKIGGYVKDIAIQILTVPFWKKVDAIGGAASVETMAVGTDGLASSDPSQPFPLSTFAVVPMRARQVNVLNTGRTA